MVYEHKRGATLDLSGRLSPTDGQTQDFTNWIGKAQIRTLGDVLIDTLVFTWLNAATGDLRIRSSGPSSAWPLGVAEIDVRFETPAGDFLYTTTQQIMIIRESTRVSA